MALPSAPPLAPGTPYTVFDNRVYYIVPTIAVRTAPTLAELNAGSDVTGCIGAVSGFATSTASLDVPRAGTGFTGNLPGRKTATDSSITYYLDTAGVDVRASQTEGLVTNVVIFTEGVKTGGHLSVFPVRLGSVSVQEDLEAVAMAEISYFIYASPAQFIAIPTS